ncbi:MAG: iron-only hydrogenase maturation protein HydE [Rickettsiales bacterium]|jgi:biotin synthase|nr:iron-only hydrogenase maturation protein HydE [Rickettsiales bacterium]
MTSSPFPVNAPLFSAEDTKLFAEAASLRDRRLGKHVHMRGVIEYTNRCYRNCTYCGIRALNHELTRYELNSDAIVSISETITKDDIPVVSLQAADHLKYDFNDLCKSVSIIREKLDRTVLLVIGDIPLEHYRDLYNAGATQAIVKFETSNADLYKNLRPHNTLADRLKLIEELDAIGYEVSSGFIYGLPGTDESDTERDIALLGELPLFAASVSPFIPNTQAPLKAERKAELVDTLRIMAQIRLRYPDLLMPSVSALNLLVDQTASPFLNYGQYLGLQAGANIMTVNYTPEVHTHDYVIYDAERHIVKLEQTRAMIAHAQMEAK